MRVHDEETGHRADRGDTSAVRQGKDAGPAVMAAALQQSAGNKAVAQLLQRKQQPTSMAQEGSELADVVEDRKQGKRQPKPKVAEANLPKAPKDADVKESDGGWLQYGPLDGMQRATYALGVLTPKLKQHGSDAQSSIKPPGWNGNKHRKFGRGHLVGKQLGGTGKDPRNLVTLYQQTSNTPWMTNVENPLAALVSGGEKILYEVKPVYDGDSPLCHTVQMTTVGTKGTYKVDELVENRELKEAEAKDPAHAWTSYHKVEFKDGKAISRDPRRKGKDTFPAPGEKDPDAPKKVEDSNKRESRDEEPEDEREAVKQEAKRRKAKAAAY